MSLTRQAAVCEAEDELFSMTHHLINLDGISASCGMSEWQGGIEQVRDALKRLASDIETTRKARVQ